MKKHSLHNDRVVSSGWFDGRGGPGANRWPHELRANIPFEFNVGDKTMPAGEYTVTPINPSSDLAVSATAQQGWPQALMIQMTT